MLKKDASCFVFYHLKVARASQMKYPSYNC